MSPLALGVMLYGGRSALFTVLVPLCCLTIATVLGHALAVASSLVARGARGLALAVLAQTIAMTPIVVIAAALADRHALGLGGRIVALAWAAQSILCAVALLVPRARAVRA